MAQHTSDKPLFELSLIIPAYNEEAAIRDIVLSAAGVLEKCVTNWEIIVVSDCSTDSTAAIAESAGARVIEQPINKGYGNALKTGIYNATYATVAIIDADGSYQPEDLQLLIPHADQFDMVVGQRIGSHFKGGVFKRAGRWIQLFLVEFTTGTKVPDVNSGLRLFPREPALHFFDTLCGGFSFTTSITLTMLMLGYTVKFIPVSYEARIGKSHISYYRDTLRSLQIITHAILKYNTIKAFLPLCYLALAGTTVSGILSIAALCYRSIAAAQLCGIIAALFFMTALIIFALGLVATTVFVTHPPAPAALPKRYTT